MTCACTLEICLEQGCQFCGFPVEGGLLFSQLDILMQRFDILHVFIITTSLYSDLKCISCKISILGLGVACFEF